MTLQEIYDQVRSHLIRQNAKSTVEDLAMHMMQCSYRGEHGLKCAVGCLIPDEDYNVALEGFGITKIRQEPTMLIRLTAKKGNSDDSGREYVR